MISELAGTVLISDETTTRLIAFMPDFGSCKEMYNEINLLEVLKVQWKLWLSHPFKI